MRRFTLTLSRFSRGPGTLGVAAVAAACVACGSGCSGDGANGRGAPPAHGSDGGGDDAEPIEATAAAKLAAHSRLAKMREITAVLKTMDTPQAALQREDELARLFADYHRLGKIGEREGLDVESGELALLIAQIAPDAREVRHEFHSYLLMVRQHGEAQREMMDRLEAIGLHGSKSGADGEADLAPPPEGSPLDSIKPPPADGPRPLLRPAPDREAAPAAPPAPDPPTAPDQPPATDP